MKRAAYVVSFVALCAWAGDRYLGTITSTGSSVNAGSTSSPFSIPTGAKLTVQCDATTYLNTDTKTAVTSSNGVKLSADQAWQTSTGYQTVTNDGGVPSSIVNVISSSGTVNCKVFQRLGTE